MNFFAELAGYHPAFWNPLRGGYEMVDVGDMCWRPNMEAQSRVMAQPLFLEWLSADTLRESSALAARAGYKPLKS